MDKYIYIHIYDVIIVVQYLLLPDLWVSVYTKVNYML